MRMPFDAEQIRSVLPDRRIEWFPSVASTMLEASVLAAAGCPAGTIVIAEEQTAGQGRHGRAWHSEPGAGLYASIVLRNRLSAENLPLVTLALGLATGDAILKATDVACDLRWPNDVLIQTRKCAGILTQVEGSAIIAGIGINVNHTIFPPDLSNVATSLRIATGRVQSREQLLVHLVASIDAFCILLEESGREPILRMFSLASSFVYGRRVDVDLGDAKVRGTTAGLNDSGFLILREDDGTENLIIAGGVRPCS